MPSGQLFDSGYDGAFQAVAPRVGAGFSDFASVAAPTDFDVLQSFITDNATSQAFQPTFGQRAFGHTNPETGVTTQGFALPAIGALSGLAEAVLGFKQFGLAKKAFKEQRRQFNRNFAAQARTTNAQLASQARARLAGSPNGNHLSEAETLRRFGIAEGP